ncbi:hypothetical protein IMCC3317_46060 [Kordia antarctica]|uniref:Uncharacterized protein n=1 Tax=Kordia antarctica TaxID=1218801 RepID=A0A7L4ZRP8_9FLAO|nr:hypothetical protein [Kordia antarctica]QHI39201.1 hypothetical protein IMCC3317_46060 [Kordia antarctica]
MLKNILNIEGLKELNKKTQTTIVGGVWHCGPDCACPEDYTCVGSYCRLFVPE